MSAKPSRLAFYNENMTYINNISYKKTIEVFTETYLYNNYSETHNLICQYLWQDETILHGKFNFTLVEFLPGINFLSFAKRKTFA